MKSTIAIVTAVSVEYEAVRSVLEDVEELKTGFSKARCSVGTIPASLGGEHGVVVIQLGMGMNAHSATAQEIQSQFSEIDAVIAVGLGASIASGEGREAQARLGDIVVCDSEVPIREDGEGWQDAVYHGRTLSSERLLSALHERRFAKGQEYFPYEIFDAAKIKLGWDLPNVPSDVRIVHGLTALHRRVVKNPESLREFDRKILAISDGFLGPLWDADKGYLRILGISDEVNSEKSDRWHGYSAVAAAAYARSVIELMPVHDSGVRIFEVPYPRNDAFYGREALIHDIHNILSAGGDDPAAVSLVGPAGIGKTQVALQYAHKYRNEYDAVFWVSADSSVRLQEGYREIANTIELPFGESQLQDLLPRLHDWFSQTANWLLVVDNADDVRIVEEALPHKGGGHVIVASRNSALKVGRTQLTVPPFSTEESVDFLMRSINAKESSANRAMAEALAARLHGFPLVLELASAHMRSTGDSFERYLNLFMSAWHNETSEISDVLKQHDGFSGADNAAYATAFRINFAAVSSHSPASADLLRLGTQFKSDRIPIDVAAKTRIYESLNEAIRESGDPIETTLQLLNTLVEFGLVKVDLEESTFSISRLTNAILDGDHENDHRKTDSRSSLTTAKCVLIGNRGVGKSALAHALLETDSDQYEVYGARRIGKTSLLQRTVENMRPARDVSFFTVPHHGSARIKDVAESNGREIILWALRGDSDVPMIDSMMIQGAAVALVLAEPYRADVLERVRSQSRWIDQASKGSSIVKLLVLPEADEPVSRNLDQLRSVLDECRFTGIVETTARDGLGINSLRTAILDAIDWDSIPKTTWEAGHRWLIKEIENYRKEGKTIVFFDELHRSLSSQIPSHLGEGQLERELQLIADQGRAFRGELPNGKVVLTLDHEKIYEYSKGVLQIAGKTGSYHADWLTWHNWSDEESAILHCTVQLMTERGLCYRDGDHFVFPSFQSAHAADKSLLEARQSLAEGNLEDARTLFVDTISEYPDFERFLRDELGFIFDFDADIASEQAKWQSRQGQIEWRRRVWAVVAQHDIKLAERADTAKADAGAKKKEVDKPKTKTVTDGKKAKVTTMTSEEKGEALEQAVEELFRFLFKVDDVDALFETFEISQQRRGMQFGFDIKLVFVDKKTGARVRCFFECKAQEDTIRLNTVAEKVAALDVFQSEPDHWVLIAPRAATQNGLKNILDNWEDRDRYDFDIQLWTKGNQAEELFGLVPKLYELWFEDAPDDERIDPSKWTDEQRNQIAAKWRSKLEAPLRLPAGWPEYVREHRHLKTFSDESDDVLTELRARHIEPRGLDETGAPLPNDLGTTIDNWLDSSSMSFILLGDFGDGKTAATYLISLSLVNRFRVNPKESWLPLRCSLRDFSRDGVRDGRDFLRRRVEEFNANVAGWQRLNSRHKAFVILDGLDEMTTALDPESVQSAMNRLLDCCREEFRDLKILLTCRTPFFHAMPERDYLLGELDSPMIVTLRNFERRDVLVQLAEQATTPAQRQRLQTLRTMHDPIGLAGKPLFFQMVSETLWDPDSDCSNEVALYESYIRKSLLRKVDLLQATSIRIARYELVLRLFRLLELVAIEIHRGKQEFACLKKIATKAEDIEYAKLLWKLSGASDVVEDDATARLGIRSLLRRVDSVETDGEDEFWPVDFCHRSMREYFVAKTLERVIRENVSEAKELLAKTDLSIETIHFAASLIRRENRSAVYHAALRSLAEQSRKEGSDLSDSERARLGKNAATLLFKSEGRLSEVDWNDMALDGVDLAGADLSGKNFSGTSLRHAILDNVNFSDANFANSDLTGVLLEETAEIQSISVAAGQDKFVAAYTDGRVRRWSLDSSIGAGSNITYEQDTQPKRLSVSSAPGSDLCLHIGNQMIFADHSEDKHVRCCDIRTRSEIVRLALNESTSLVVEERRDSTYVAELFDLNLQLPVKLCSVSIGSSWLCAAFGTKALSFVVDGEVVVQDLCNDARTPICKMHQMSALSIGSVSESEFLIGCGSQSGELKVLRCGFTEDGISVAEVLASRPHDAAVSSIAFIEDHSVLTGSVDRKIVRSDLRAEATGEVLDTFALQVQCAGMNVTDLTGETERETLIALGAKTLS